LIEKNVSSAGKRLALWGTSANVDLYIVTLTDCLSSTLVVSIFVKLEKKS